MEQIINGPNKESLMKSFGNRLKVTVTLDGNKKVQMLINTLQHEDGSGNSFNFIAMDGATGYYNARTKHGLIK
jgi:hypothetical protein